MDYSFKLSTIDNRNKLFLQEKSIIFAKGIIKEIDSKNKLYIMTIAIKAKPY
jgi:hypothetical protein